MAPPVRSVWSFPRPPAMNKVSKRLRVVTAEGTVLADTTEGYEILETSHPPTYYLPSKDCQMQLLKENARSSFCEWKGQASYYDFTPVEGGETVRSRIWTYHRPNKSYEALKDHLSFYVGPWKCFVDDEEVTPQDGSFYGGWLTSDITGKDEATGRDRGIKGAAGTRHW